MEQIINRSVWCILGLPFDEVNKLEAVECVDKCIKNSNQLFLTTPNLNFIITAQSDKKFFQSVVDSNLIVADGIPIVWVARFLGIPVTKRVAGSDLFDLLSNRPWREKKMSVFFFGGQAGIAEQACQKLNNSSDAMWCCGFYAPGFVSVDEMSTSAIINFINKANPDFLVVALGAGKGQEWIQKNRHRINASVISHLGAVINFVARYVKRAPLLWQRCGLEWLWRIKQEPALWRRYFFDGLAFVKLIVFKIFPLALYDRWLRCSNLFKTPANISHNTLDKCVINLSGSVHYAKLNTVKQCFADMLLSNKRDIVLNFSGLVYVDAAFLGLLVIFQGYLNDQSRQLYLQNVPKRISRLLDLNNVLNRFQYLVDS